MKSIFIQDNKGYGKKRISTFIKRYNIKSDMFFVDNFDYIPSDAGHFFFVVNDVNDFLYYVKKYASFYDHKFIITDTQLIPEFKKCGFDYFTFKKFYDFISD